VNTPTVEHVVFKDTQIGLMTIHQFAEPTSAQFDKAIESLAEQQIKGLVIDLRDNPGGLLQSDIEMLSRFVSDKVVVTIKSRDGIEEVPKTYANQTRRWPFPIAVIMNEDTASAAEIFAGALQDYRLATLVGVHSYGKASVQNLWPLRDGSSAKITIGRYYLPSGNDIGRKVDEDGQFLTGGLQPDVRVENDPDDTNIELGNPAKDPQLKKAIEVLQAKQ
jgi:carboxyl-terminal processing protease